MACRSCSRRRTETDDYDRLLVVDDPRSIATFLSAALQPAVTAPESSIREGGFEPPPPDSKSGSLPVSRFPSGAEGEGVEPPRLIARPISSRVPSPIGLPFLSEHLQLVEMPSIRAPAGGVEPPIVALTGRRLSIRPHRYHDLFAAPRPRIGMAGFEPAISCSRSRRIEPGFPTSRTKCPAGVEPALPPWQGDRLPLHHGHCFPKPNFQGNKKHRVGLEPTLPHYGCGVLAAGRPVLFFEWDQRGSNPHPPG